MYWPLLEKYSGLGWTLALIQLKLLMMGKQMEGLFFPLVHEALHIRKLWTKRLYFEVETVLPHSIQDVLACLTMHLVDVASPFTAA